MNKEVIDRWAYTLRNTIYSPHYIGCEISGNLQIAISYAYLNQMDLYLFGTLDNMDCFTKFFKHEGLHVKAVIERLKESDSLCRRRRDKIFDVPIILLDEIATDVNEPEKTVIFSFSQMEGNEAENFNRIVENVKIQKVFNVDSRMRTMITNNTLEECDRNRIIFYQDNVEKIIELLPYYDDEESYRVMNEYIRTYSERDAYRGTEIKSLYKYFFDTDKRDLYSHLENEVWLNFGANTGDTIFCFFPEWLESKKNLCG